MAEWKISSIRVESHIEEVTEEVRQRVIDWLDAIGQDARSTASQDGICPRKTGTLQRSIDYHVFENDLKVQIGTNIKYARVQEFGYEPKNITGKHYLQYGATAHMSEYQRLLQDALEA